MIKFEKTEVTGWEAAIRGMRNPMNSWDKSDSRYCLVANQNDCANCEYDRSDFCDTSVVPYIIGKNDLALMQRLRKSGTDHRKYLRMISVSADITAPLYWWKEFDTYKVGTSANSCSTMHKIHSKEFTIDDFSCEHLKHRTLVALKLIIRELNVWREIYLKGYTAEMGYDEIYAKSKDSWWQLIQILPSSYNQKRTVMLNYEVLNNIYKSRKNHKLDEWSVGFMEWIKNLPYAKELIIGDD